MFEHLLPVSFLMFGLGCAITMVVFWPKEYANRFRLVVLTSIIGLALIVLVSAFSLKTGNIFRQAFVDWSEDGRPGIAIRAAAISLGVFSGFAIAQASKLGRKQVCWMAVILLFSLAAFTSLLAKDFIGQFLPNPEASVTAGVFATDSIPGAVVQKIELPLSPTAMAYHPDGRLFVAGYSGGYMQGGAIVSITQTAEGFDVKTVAQGLTRPHGLAIWKDWLYVSRSGQLANAKNGAMHQERTGRVTRMKDTDGDGVFDFYDDVVSDLPGAQAPDGLHQNNGITFSKDGKLFITVGVSTDHSPPVEKYEGTILVCNPDGKNLKEFAKGLRNAYGITHGPLGKLFCTDNDPNFSEMGDKLIVVEEGKHYGHPYDAFAELKVAGIEPPIRRFSSAQGISFIPADETNPWAGKLLLAAYGDDAISALNITSVDGEYHCEPEFLARVNDVVDVCYATDGALFACSYIDRNLYRIQLPATKGN